MGLKGIDLVIVAGGSVAFFIVLPLAFYYVWKNHRAKKAAAKRGKA